MSPNTLISNSASVSGATTNELAVNSLQVNNSGTYFVEPKNQCYNNKSFDIDLDVISQIFVNTDLLHHWPLNNTFNDIVGNNNATPTNMIFDTGRNEGANSAVRGNTTSSSLEFDNAINDIEGTISLWVFANPLAQSNKSFLVSPDNQSLLFAGVNNEIAYRNNNVMGSNAWTVTSYILQAGWNHLVMAKNGTEIKIYINNELIVDANNGMPMTVQPYKYIGSHPSSAITGINYKFDDIRYYNKFLNATEVRALFEVPSISSFPEASVDVCDGQTFSLSAEVGGNISFLQWKKDGVDLVDDARISGSNTASLTIQNFNDATDSGNYTLEVGEECYYDVTPVSVVSEGGSNITITLQPQDVSVCSSQPASMSVQTSGDTPTGYQWKKDGVPLTDSGNISGANTLTLSFSPAFVPNTGLYTVEILGSNCGTLESDFAVLNVASVPNASISPVSPSICEGESIELSVANAGAGANYAWSNGLPNSNSVTVSPNTTTTYSVTVTNAQNCSATESRQVVVTPSPAQPTNTTPAANLNVCTGETTTLTASASGTIRWYANATGGPILATGNSFTTPTLSANTVYYAENFQNDCVSDRLAINVNVGSTPSAPVNNTPSANLTVCSGSTTDLSVSSTSGTVEWFNSPTSTNVLATGNNFTTPALSTGTTSYYVSASFGSCSSARTQIEVPVNANPSAPTNVTAPANSTICSGETTLLEANASSIFDNVNWYDAATGGNLLTTGETFSTPALTTNTTYYTEAVNSNTGCISSQTAITVTVTPTPNQPTNTTLAANLNVCTGENTTLTASAAGTVRWYADATGGPILATGNSFTTPSLSANAVYYAENFQNDCVSDRLAINVNVGSTPTAPVNNTPAANLTVCSGSTTDLSVSSTSGTVEWFDSPTSTNVLATGNNFTTPTLSVGTISYYVSASFGSCSSTRTQIEVTVNETPALPSNTTPVGNLTICSGQNTTLTASLNGSNQILNWYATLVSTSPIASGASFTTPSLTDTTTYYIAATSNDGLCESDRIAVTVNVNPIPTAVVTPSNPEICEGDSITLVASGGSLYNWNSTGFSSESSITVAPTAFTTYSVIVRENNCNALANTSVFVNSNPALEISPTNPEICLGEDIQLSALGTGSVEWENGLGTNANITVEPTVNTTYTVTLTDANNCSSTESVSVIVNEVVASINGPTTICEGLDAILTASGGDTYLWADGLGTDATITVNPTNATTYEVTVTGAGGCTAVASQTVSVQNAPTVVINGNQEICLGDDVVLEANGANTYEWADGLGTDATITVSPTTTTTYSVTGSLGAGCTSDTSITVVVNQPSSSQIAETICFGDSYDFEGTTYTTSGVYTATLTNAVNCDSVITLDLTVLPENSTNLEFTLCDGTSFEFDGQVLTTSGNYSATFPDANNCDSTVNLTLNFVNEILVTINESICEGESFEFDGQNLTNAGEYEATFASSGGCDSIVTLNLTVNELPNPIVTENNLELSTGSFETYQWYLNNDEIAGADLQSYTATENGDYTVVVSDANGCSNVSNVVSVVGLSIKDVFEFKVALYPNPANSVVNIEAEKNIEQVEIIDIMGKVVYRKNSVNNNRTLLNIEHLAQATYIVKITNTNGDTASLPFVKW